jgi:hypothetical protein
MLDTVSERCEAGRALARPFRLTDDDFLYNEK